MSANNLHSPGKHTRSLSKLDFYRRVPRDLTEATSVGATMSVIAMALMGLLFVSESLAFARTEMATSIELDINDNKHIRINFNVSMLDVHCDYVVVDVLDALGTNKQNITKNVEKWQLDADGVRRAFSGRNREMRDLVHEQHSPEKLAELQQLVQDEENHAIELTDEASYDEYLKTHEVAFIDFYAPWCIWCQRLHPTWELFAQEVYKEKMPVGVAMVNCVEHNDLCRRADIRAFPVLRWFSNGEAVVPDYNMDRTVSALVSFSKRRLETNEKLKDWQKRKAMEQADSGDRNRNMMAGSVNPGCEISGHLMVNRVPGNFHIEARSKSQSINPTMANLTHQVHHLSFGDPLEETTRKHKRILKQVPDDHKEFAPLDGQMFATGSYHQAWHHHIKVVSTHFIMGDGKANRLMTYQFLEQSQIVYYQDEDIPEARFAYDISPMSVVVKKERRKWYDYLTSLCAIIGGTFTTLGLIDASLYRVLKSKKVD
mmetsp:Transcript_19066/g.27097  ORF Transcript_19066/g.27097 Transcript_19066/m.27097 type:complete len:486 (+) Transcript_19066:57-1514(+)